MQIGPRMKAHGNEDCRTAVGHSTEADNDIDNRFPAPMPTPAPKPALKNIILIYNKRTPRYNNIIYFINLNYF